MPRLLIVDHFVSAGGVERFLHGLMSGLLELPEINEWNITVLLNKYNSGGYIVKLPEHLTAPNVHVEYLYDDGLSRINYQLTRSRRIWGIPGTAKIQRAVPYLLRSYGTKWMKRHSGDPRFWIEHYCSQQHFDVAYFCFPILMECPQIPVPMVSTPHDFNYKRFDTLGAYYRAQIERQMPAWFQKCKKLIVSSDFIASELRHFYPEYFSKVEVIRLGIPGNKYNPTEKDLEAYRLRMGLPQQFLLTAGWIAPHKNHKVLFEALALLRTKSINIPLVCIGPNSHLLKPENKHEAEGYTEDILKLIENLNLVYGRDFIGLGYVDDFEIECLYRLATALVMPTLYEAGSFPAREAMRAGCPVILSKIPSHEEENNLVNGNIWLFEPLDSGQLAEVIEEVLDNNAIRNNRAKEAAQIVTKVFSWEKTAKGYLAIFQELAKK